MLSKSKTAKSGTHPSLSSPMDWGGRWYDFLLYLPERWLMSKWRKALWRFVGSPTGRLLEIGVGTGKNFPFYPPNTEIWAVDINPSMLARARKKLTTATAPVQLVLADVESLPFEDNSFDTVIATFVFCNVPNPIQGFREIRRVLKPNGIAYFLEHMIPMTPRKARFFDRLDPWVYKAIGDHINRRTDQNVELAGMSIQKIIPLTSDGVVRLIIARPNKGGIS